MANNWPKQITLSDGSIENSFIFSMANRTVSSLWDATMIAIFLSSPLSLKALILLRHSVSVLWYISVVASKLGLVGSGYPIAAALARSCKKADVENLKQALFEKIQTQIILRKHVIQFSASLILLTIAFEQLEIGNLTNRLGDTGRKPILISCRSFSFRK